MGLTVWGSGFLYLPARLTGCFLQSRSLLGSYPMSPLVASLKLETWLEVRRVLLDLCGKNLRVLGPLLQRWGIFSGCSFAD